MMRTVLATALLAVVALQAQEEPTFRVNVKLVRLLATVKDVNGTPIGGLEKRDFFISENGVKQEIALFERHTAQPLSVAILLDISGSTAKEMKYQTEAVNRFLGALLREGNPDDRAALYAFNWQVVREVNFTRNLDRFKVTLKAEAGTSLWDAILLASDDIADRDGRHVLVVISDGGDTVSRASFQQALEAAHRADAVVYPILTIPITNEAGRNIGGENAMTFIARTTGGKLFAPGVNGLDDAFAELLRDLRTQYLIGYYPKGVPPSKDRFHRIEIKTARSDLRVITRTGYYGESEDSAEPAVRSRESVEGPSPTGPPRKAPRTTNPPQK